MATLGVGLRLLLALALLALDISRGGDGGEAALSAAQ